MSVYFIKEEGGGYIKIGKGNGYDRKKCLQTGTPWEFKVGNKNLIYFIEGIQYE